MTSTNVNNSGVVPKVGKVPKTLCDCRKLIYSTEFHINYSLPELIINIPCNDYDISSMLNSSNTSVKARVHLGNPPTIIDKIFFQANVIECTGIDFSKIISATACCNKGPDFGLLFINSAPIINGEHVLNFSECKDAQTAMMYIMTSDLPTRFIFPNAINLSNFLYYTTINHPVTIETNHTANIANWLGYDNTPDSHTKPPELRALCKIEYI